MQPSTSSSNDDLLSRSTTHFVTAPPTLQLDEVLGAMPPFSIDENQVVVYSQSDDNDNDDDGGGGHVGPDDDDDLKHRVKSQIANSFETRGEISQDIIALVREFTLNDWRDALLLSRAFSVPHLLRLCQLCESCEALFDAILIHVLPMIANSCVLETAADLDDVEETDERAADLVLPADVSMLLDSVARFSSLRSVPLSQLNTHALLEPLNATASSAPASNVRQLFRQRILQCSMVVHTT
jgi:hypothetical protein